MINVFIYIPKKKQEKTTMSYVKLRTHVSQWSMIIEKNQRAGIVWYWCKWMLKQYSEIILIYLEKLDSQNFPIYSVYRG